MEQSQGPQLQMNAPKAVPSVPLMKTATINITISPQSSINGHHGGYPMQKNSSRSSFNSDSMDLNASMGRISLRSEGSQVSFVSGSRTPSRSASIRSHQSTPPVTPGDSQPANNQHPLNGKTDTDSAMGSSPEDKTSERSFGSNNETFGGSRLSTTNGVVNGTRKEDGHLLIAMYMDKEVIVVIKVCCQSEATLANNDFLALMVQITSSCGVHLRKNDEETELTSVFVNKLKMADGKPAKEHFSELSRQQSAGITISDIKFWRTTDPQLHVAPYVDGVVKSEGRCTLARAGAILTLRKTSKYAPVEEFAKQLCDQIAKYKPVALGNKERALELQKQKTQNQQSQLPQKPQAQGPELLTQTYLFDSTINVAEAARRSFVDVVGYLAL